jgi:aspartate/methionine/tyrosine aminotransferase
MIESSLLQKLRQIANAEERISLLHSNQPEKTNLAVAENVLIFDRIQAIIGRDPIEEKDTKYITSYGTDDFREKVARFLGETFGVPLERDDVSCVAGVSAALECLAFILSPPGATAILPTPCWQGFDWSFAQRPGWHVKPINLYSDQRYELTLEKVREACETEERGALVLTNPNNPLGLNYNRDLLESIYDYVLKKTHLHIISDEIYCHSQVAGIRDEFTSAFALNAYKIDPDRVHVVWGFAKDFGLSGFKAGVILSRSQEVCDALRDQVNQKSMAWFTPFDALKHKMLGKAMNGDVRALMKVYQQRLTAAFTAVKGSLDCAPAIAHIQLGNPAQFFWLDLRKCLKAVPKDLGDFLFEDIDPSEEALRSYIANDAGVFLLPGQTMHSAEPGFFRLCYTAVQTGEVINAVGRVKRSLAKLQCLN